MKVHSIETFGTHEGPGIRLVVFLQGCNFRCAYCHNPDTITPTGGKDFKVSEIIRLLEDQKPYFGENGGLTVSGGEPTLQAKELIDLFREAKRLNFHTALDTNASILNKDVKELLSLTDLALFDLKHFDNEVHKHITGSGNELTLKTIEFRENSQKPFWVRYVLVPGLTDKKEHLESVAKHLSQFKYLEYLELLPYHNLGIHKYKELGLKYRLQDIPPATANDLKRANSIIIGHLPKEKIRY